MLTISNLTYRIAGRALFEGADAQIAAGHRVGLVGRNGTGKSTLFGLILGELHPDGGEISLPSEARLGVVAQEAPAGDRKPIEIVLEADRERHLLLTEAETAEDPDRVGEIHMRLAEIDAHAAPSRAAAILAGLGFDEAMQHRPMSSFSGGWRMRVALAAALFAEPDILLLDEPTNHLDLEATAWLESYLKTWPNTLVVISHDRSILNEVVDHILHLEGRKLTLYRGGYDAFEGLRAARIEQSRAMAAKQEERRKHLQSFVDRFRAQATKARQAQSRLKMLSRMSPVSVLAEDPSIRFVFPEPANLSPPLISLDRVDVGYSADRPILRNLDLRLDPQDRVALLGANGNGKSTLAKLLAGRLKPLAGRETRSPKLNIGFFAQHQVEEMDLAATPFQHMARAMKGARDGEVRAKLGRFGFGQDKAFVETGALSGGERARLNLALVTHDAPALLILDEPTNHLDIDSREALAEAINDYAGAVVLVTHDWHLLEMTADRLWLVADGAVTPFDGDLEDYRKLMLGRGRPRRDAGTPSAANANERAGKAWDEKGRGEKGGGDKGGGGKRKGLGPLRQRAKDAEARLQSVAQEKAEIEAKLGGAVAAAARADLARRLKDLTQTLAQAERVWLEAEEALDAAQ